MNTEAELISAVCKNKDISTLLADNADELFTSHRDIWDSLKSYYYKFKAVPEVGVLMERHKDFEPVTTNQKDGEFKRFDGNDSRNGQNGEGYRY